MAFTWWKLFASNQRRARLHRQRRRCQYSKQSDMGARQSFLHQPLDASYAVASKIPGLLRPKNTQYGGCSGVVSTRPRRRASHHRRCCQAVRDNNVPDLSALPTRPGGKDIVFRTGKGLRAGLSSTGNNENNDKGLRASPCAGRDLRRHNDGNSSPAMHGADNRTSMLNHAAGEQRSEEAATPLNPPSPFVAGGPLCAKHPSYWTVTGISALNTVGPTPLFAWTEAATGETQQQVSALGPAPNEGGYKRRDLGMPFSRSASANRSKHRRIVPPAGIVAATGCFPSCVGIMHHHKDKLKMSAFHNGSQDFPGRMRASSAPGRRTKNDSDIEGRVSRRPFLPRQGAWKTTDETREGSPQPCSMYFGRYMVLLD